MNLLIIGNRNRYEKYKPNYAFINNINTRYISRNYRNEDILDFAPLIDAIFIDPMSHLDKEVIDYMPKLQLVQSEGVGYDKIDIQACKDRGIYVCNCRGANESAVAEQVILLMLGCLRNVIVAHETMLAGKQIEMKESLMYEGIVELGDCKVGLIGLGAIGQATAKRLKAFGCDIVYNDIKRNTKLEKKLGITYNDINTLIKTCDIISLHAPVTDKTTRMVNEVFLKNMKKTAYLINTARGELIDNQALYDAIINEEILGAGLDTISPEPVLKDNILLNLPDEYQNRIILSPHIGGITNSFFKRSQIIMYTNLNKILKNKKPEFIVNGL
ncbi:MAG: NAD(P)-binding domain-containing protein [Erysipelotrichaceae bacterium]|nr:NAD(P)-binding domain-containing protein [Erysipelotrichaceae bacterium]